MAGPSEAEPPMLWAQAPMRCAPELTVRALTSQAPKVGPEAQARLAGQAWQSLWELALAQDALPASGAGSAWPKRGARDCARPWAMASAAGSAWGSAARPWQQAGLDEVPEAQARAPLRTASRPA